MVIAKTLMSIARLQLGLLSFLLPGAGLAAVFTAEVDRKELYVNEHVLLTLSLSDSETRLRAEGVSPNVDLTVLTGEFELGVPRADFRFNINRNRGRATSSIAVELFPRAAGRLSIPPFSIDGVSTATIELRVLDLPADAAPEVFARSGLARNDLHPREQTLLYLDLYHRVELKGARLGGSLDSRPRWIEAHALPAEERTERFGDFEYRVTRTAWAVSPVTDEDIILLLPDIWVETVHGRQWRLPFGEERIAVRGVPDDVPEGTLIGRPQLEQSAPPTASAGEAVPWEVVLRSETALNALPAEPPLESTPGLSIYLDPPERRLEVRDGRVQSVAVYRGHLMAGTAGAYSTPALRIGYYDPASGRAASLHEPGTPLRITPAPHAVEPLTTPGQAAPGHGDAPSHAWKWIALASGGLWLATLALWAMGRLGGNRRGRNKGGRNTAAAVSHKDRVLAAFGTRTLEEGLRAWEARHGRHADMREAVREVQRLCYRSAGAPDEDALGGAADRVLARLRDRPATAPLPDDDTEDPWSPRAFRPSHTVPRPAE